MDPLAWLQTAFLRLHHAGTLVARLRWHTLTKKLFSEIPPSSRRDSHRTRSGWSTGYRGESRLAGGGFLPVSSGLRRAALT